MHLVARIIQSINEKKLKAAKGATEQQILEFERTCGIALPDQVRELYKLSNGIELIAGSLWINSLEKALEFEALRSKTWGYYPFADSYAGDVWGPWCLCCKSPVQSHVVRDREGDGPIMLFRNVDNCVAALAKCLDQDDWDPDCIPGDYNTPDRTSSDIETGRKLIELAPQLRDNNDRNDALRWSATLLSEEQTEEIASLLENEDSYVIQCARKRLQEMQSAKVRSLLVDYAQKRKAFAQQLLDKLTSAGLPYQIHNEEYIPGLQMDFLYATRNDTTRVENLIKRLKAKPG